MEQQIRVVIADDQLLLRNSLEQIIDSDPQIEVVASVGTGDSLIKSCSDNKPDLVLMDVEMPEIDGISALKILKKNQPEIKVLILTTFDNPDYITDALIGDADGYITKDIGYEKLIASIKCVSYGLIVIHPGARTIIKEKLQSRSKVKDKYTDILSIEEINIVRLIVLGESNRSIGENLYYSEGTVKNKVSKIYEKLGIANRLELAVFAVENGIE